MKTMKELQAEVKDLGEKAKDISTKVDLQETYKGIETFDADLVMTELNSLATYHENLSIKFNEYSKENLYNSSKAWAENADGHFAAAKEVRERITTIIRTQKIINNIRNNNNE